MKLDTDVGGPGELALNLTPMIDVVFLLLIFFMLATTFMDPEREIDLDLPEAASSLAQDTERDEIIINVMRDGVLKLGESAVDRDGLLAELRRAARRNPEIAVTIRGDRLVTHEVIVSVMDACGQAGLRNLAVGTIQGA
jgi:biopolymer transport protein ExbD